MKLKMLPGSFPHLFYGDVIYQLLNIKHLFKKLSLFRLHVSLTEAWHSDLLISVGELVTSGWMMSSVKAMKPLFWIVHVGEILLVTTTVVMMKMLASDAVTVSSKTLENVADFNRPTSQDKCLREMIHFLYNYIVKLYRTCVSPTKGSSAMIFRTVIFQ